MEEDVLGARGVLEDGEDRRHGAADVGSVEGHCHVDGVIGADFVAIVLVGVHLFIFGGDGGTRRGVVELRSFSELLGGGGGTGIIGGSRERGVDQEQQRNQENGKDRWWCWGRCEHSGRGGVALTSFLSCWWAVVVFL